MTESLTPYITACHLCEQGFLRMAHCRHCQRVVAICDECEAVWKELWALKTSAPPPPDAQHPECPYCGNTETSWSFLSAEDIESLGLSPLISGYSR